MRAKQAAGLIPFVLMIVMAPGCATISTLSYRQDPASGVGGQTTKVYLLERATTAGGSSEEQGQTQPLTEDEVAKLGSDFDTGLLKCQAKEPLVPGGLPLPLVLPLVGFAVQQGVDYATSLVAERAQTIQKSSVQTYEARVIVGDPKRFAASECLLLVRRGPRSTAEKTGDQVNLVALLRIERVGTPPGPDAFELRPLFVQMDNAVAWTAAGQPVSLALAVAGKGARTDKDRSNEIKLFAQSTMKIPGLAFGKPVKDVASTGLIPLPPDDVTAIELTVGVTEVGAGAPDADRVKAETTALAKAVGPALASQAQALFQEPTT